MFNTNKRPRLVLFIGHHKVGSTSLQDYFARNAPALAKSGILYPFVDFQGLSYLAAGLAKPFDDLDNLPINIREPHNALAFRMMATSQGDKVPGYHQKLPGLPQMEYALQQQLEFFNPHTVVMAAEVFSNFSVRSPEMIERLLAIFEGFDVTLLATFRRVDEYMMSWHGQRLKFGHTLRRLSKDGLDNFLGDIHFDYGRLLEGWLTQLPDAKIILRDYADVRNAGGSVADFVAQGELQLPEGLWGERRQNDSLHRGIYELVRRGNIELDRPLSGQYRSVLRDLSDGMDLPKSNEIEMFGSDVRAQIVEKFAPINVRLGEIAQMSGPFFSDDDAVLKTLPVSEDEVMASAKAQALKAWPDLGPVSEARDYLISQT
jgi:hypothetical protein